MLMMNTTVAGQYENKISPSKELKCTYKSGKCGFIRTVKANGQLHSLCAMHRDKQNSHQRKSDRKMRKLRRNQDIITPYDTLNGSKYLGMNTNSMKYTPTSLKKEMYTNNLSSKQAVHDSKLPSSTHSYHQYEHYQRNVSPPRAHRHHHINSNPMESPAEATPYRHYATQLPHSSYYITPKKPSVRVVTALQNKLPVFLSPPFRSKFVKPTVDTTTLTTSYNTNCDIGASMEPVIASVLPLPNLQDYLASTKVLKAPQQNYSGNFKQIEFNSITSTTGTILPKLHFSTVNSATYDQNLAEMDQPPSMTIYSLLNP